MLVVGKVFGRRTLRLYLTAIITGAVVFGLCIDYLLPQHWFKVSGMIMSGGHCAHCLGTMDWVWMTIFLLLLVNAFVDRLRHSWMLRKGKRKEERGELNIKEGDTVSDITIYDVKEMACNHCKANVEKIISGIAGVESVEVDLVKGIAYVHGQHDHSEVERQVTANGYPTTLKV